MLSAVVVGAVRRQLHVSGLADAIVPNSTGFGTRVVERRASPTQQSLLNINVVYDSIVYDFNLIRELVPPILQLLREQPEIACFPAYDLRLPSYNVYYITAAGWAT